MALIFKTVIIEKGTLLLELNDTLKYIPQNNSV